MNNLDREEDTGVLLRAIDDESFFEEGARRLCAAYLRDHGKRFMHGRFEWIFHDGRFQGIEEHPRIRRYVSPKRKSVR